MKSNYVFISIIILLLSVIVWQNINKPEQVEKYEIKNFDGLVIMYDKVSGLAWRNVLCSDTKVLHCWSLMKYNGAVVPDGDQKRRDFEFEKLGKEVE